MQLSAYRSRAQEYATALNGAHHRHFSGLDGDWDPEAIHKAHAGCLDLLTIEELGNEAMTGNAGARRLWAFAVRSRLRAAAAGYDAERTRREAASPLATLTAALVAEPDVRRRLDLEEQRLIVVVDQLTAPAGVALQRVREEVRRIGWPSARALWSAMTGVDIGRLARDAEQLLREEEPPPLDGAVTRADGPRWHRAAWADPWFPADALLPLLRDALARRGIDPDAPGFAIDAQDRPGKSPRAFCAAVHVPDEIHLVVRPGGGIQDAEALLHEAGHALLLAARDRDWRFEERHLVPAHVCEAAAFNFEHELPDHGEARIRQHLDAARALRRRRQAARFLHELDLLDHGPVQELRERYARRMARATGLDWPGAPWLVDADPLLTAADYVRAEQLVTAPR